jgi:hypothetical protein
VSLKPSLSTFSSTSTIPTSTTPRPTQSASRAQPQPPPRTLQTPGRASQVQRLILRVHAQCTRRNTDIDLVCRPGPSHSCNRTKRNCEGR